jgi:hypothetical protein
VLVFYLFFVTYCYHLIRKNKYCTTAKSYIKHKKKSGSFIVSKNHIQHAFHNKKLMAHQTNLSLHTIPVQLVYQILDHIDNETLFKSCYGVCQRLNAIMDTYQPYQVIFSCIFPSVLRCIILFFKKYYFD